jgi:hypothetical protein
MPRWTSAQQSGSSWLTLELGKAPQADLLGFVGNNVAELRRQSKHRVPDAAPTRPRPKRGGDPTGLVGGDEVAIRYNSVLLYPGKRLVATNVACTSGRGLSGDASRPKAGSTSRSHPGTQDRRRLRESAGCPCTLSPRLSFRSEIRTEDGTCSHILAHPCV